MSLIPPNYDPAMNLTRQIGVSGVSDWIVRLLVMVSEFVLLELKVEQIVSQRQTLSVSDFLVLVIVNDWTRKIRNVFDEVSRLNRMSSCLPQNFPVKSTKIQTYHMLTSNPSPSCAAT